MVKSTAIKIYKAEDIEDILGISKSSVYKLLQSGQLKSKRIGRVYRIPSTYLDEYLAHPYSGNDSEVLAVRERSVKQ